MVDETPPPSVEQRQVDCLIDNCDGTNLKKFMLHVSKLHRDVPMERIVARSCADGRILRAESLVTQALKCCRCEYKCFSAKADNSAVMKLKVHWEKEAHGGDHVDYDDLLEDYIIKAGLAPLPGTSPKVCLISNRLF